MLDTEESFFTLVGCIDGRVQNILIRFGRERFKTRFPDTITEAGLVGLLSKENIDQHLLESLRKKIQISLEIHHSKGIIVYGHEECAGNPVDDEQHKKDVLKASKIIQSMINNSVPVIPVFVSRFSHGWIAKELK